jgi:hypothetical protein
VEWLTMDGRQGGCMAFQYGTKLKNLIDLGTAQLRHKGAAVALGANKSLGAEASERVTNRGARNANAVRQLFLQQALPRLKTAADDLFADGAVGDAAGARHGGYKRMAQVNLYTLMGVNEVVICDSGCFIPKVPCLYVIL